VSNTGNRFRTVAFGGFHKQDVLDYITSTNKEQQDQTAALKQQAESALQERETLAEKAESAEAARKKCAEECERLSATLTERTTELERVQRELTALKAEHEKAAARLEEIEARLPTLEADAQAYAELKDHTATIELEARRKAQETEDQARDRAAKIRSELESWLRRVQGSYQRLRTDVNATVTHLTGELERSHKAMEEVAPAFQQHDQSLAQLLERERAEVGPKAPEPLPLEEEVQEESQETQEETHE
jgi:chromosome segregation ATPase